MFQESRGSGRQKDHLFQAAAGLLLSSSGEKPGRGEQEKGSESGSSRTNRKPLQQEEDY